MPASPLPRRGIDHLTQMPKLLATLSLLAALAVLVAGCGGGDDSTSSGGETASGGEATEASADACASGALDTVSDGVLSVSETVSIHSPATVRCALHQPKERCMDKRLATVAGCLLLTACSHMSLRSSAATATLGPTKGNQAAGTVAFVQRGSTVYIDAHLTGLSPGLHPG